MKTLITFICALLMFACGGNTTNKTTTTNTDTPVVENSGPPWDSLSAQEKEVYVNDHACFEATDMMHKMVTWPLIQYAEEVSPGRFVYAVQHSASGWIGFVQYREAETRVYEMGMLFLTEDDALTFVDYHVLRAIHTGAVSPDSEDALSLATGEYFCVYM